MPTTVLRSDPRFALASRTRNARFPSREADLAGRVEYCYDADDVARALQQTLHAGLRPTVRSSGHCYEDFVVNNPNGAILDVSGLNRVLTGANGAGPYSIGPGTMLGNVYQDLYTRAGKTIPGGTCFTVTAGGHISGGGYGTLCRLYGITVDHVSAIDVITVNASGHAIAQRVSKTTEPDLFRALRGGQANNFGIITNFHFDQLPHMPDQVVIGGLSWDWNEMTEDKFVTILRTWGDWHETHCDTQETWGLFSMLQLTSKSSGRMGLSVSYTQPEGEIKDLSILNDFLNRFETCRPAKDDPTHGMPSDVPRERLSMQQLKGDSVCYGQHQLQRRSWLEATVGGQAGTAIATAERGRAKYKSCYMRKNFTEQEARLYFKALTDPASTGIVALCDSYGGATNTPQRIHDTAIAQRSSCMKIQFMTFWSKPEDDETRLASIRKAYNTIYGPENSAVDAAHTGTPWHGDQYEGCYINYPDTDMTAHDFWPQLYYGTGDLYPFLQGVKRKYDPHNIFHHAMSIKA